jgi:hypothetical protein
MGRVAVTWPTVGESNWVFTALYCTAFNTLAAVQRISRLRVYTSLPSLSR